MSARVRLIMMIFAISFAAGMFGILALNSSLHQETTDQNHSLKIPALGPKDARPKALELKWKTEPTSKDNWLSVSSLKGKVIYINFWASWCEPCKHELPYIEKLKKSYRPDHLITVLVNLDDSTDSILEAKKMQNKLAPTTDALYHSATELREIYNIHALPMHILIDKDGHTAASFYARIDEKFDEFNELLHDLISE